MSLQLPKDFHTVSASTNKTESSQKPSTFHSKLMTKFSYEHTSNDKSTNGTQINSRNEHQRKSPHGESDLVPVNDSHRILVGEYPSFNPIQKNGTTTATQKRTSQSTSQTKTQSVSQSTARSNNSSSNADTHKPIASESRASRTTTSTSTTSHETANRSTSSANLSMESQDEIEFKMHMDTLKKLMRTKDLEQMVWSITKPKKADEKTISDYFHKKVILITGASKGLGRHLAILLSKYKARLVLCARNMDALYETRKECLRHGADEVLVVGCDVCVEMQCKKVVDAAINRFRRIDILLLNAGVSGNQLFVDMKDLSTFKHMFQQNTMGYVHFVFHALPHMREQGSGHIAAISSMSGKIGVPYRTAYCTSKHAVQGFFETLRNELKADPNCDIKVTVCSPGWIQTDISESYLLNDKASQRNHYKLSPNECAEGVLNAIVTNTREERFQTLYRMMPFIHAVCPDYVDAVALKAVGLNPKSKL